MSEGEKVSIVVDVDTATGEANVRQLGESLDQAGRRGERGLGRSASALDRLKERLTPTIGLATQLAAAFGAYQLGQMAAGFLDVAASMETYQTTLATVLHSQAKAQEYFEWIREFASSTPFEIPGLVEAATRLEAYGLAAKEYMRTLGDTAAAMGKPLMAAVEMIADASQGEFERMKEFGLRATDVAAAAGFATVQEMTSTRNNLVRGTETLMRLLEERYSGGMEKLSTSWSGMVSNLSDSWTTFQMTVMDSGVFDSLKAGLMTVMDVLGEQSAQLGDWAASLGQTVTASFKIIVEGAYWVGKAFLGWKIIWEGVKLAWDATQAAIWTGMAWLADKVAWLLEKYATVKEFFGQDAFGTRQLAADLRQFGDESAAAADILVDEMGTKGVAALKDAVAGVDRLDAAAANLRTRFEAHRKTLAQHSQATEADTKATTEQTTAINQTAAALDTLGATGSETADKLRQLDDESRLAAMDDHARQVEEITARYDDLRAVTTQLAAAGEITWDEANRRLDAYDQRQQEALDRMKSTHMQTASAVEKIWDGAWDRMTDSLADFIRSGEFELDDLVDYFENAVSQMVAAWLTGQASMVWTAGSGGSIAGGSGAAAAASAAGFGGLSDIFGDSGIMMGLDQIFNTGGAATAVTGTYAMLTGEFNSWAMDAAGWGSLDVFGDALVGFSDSLQPVADWLTDLSFALDDMPIVGDLGLGGTLSGISAIYNFSEGNTTDALIDTAIAGLYAWNPVIGGAASIGYAIGEFIADIFGFVSSPSPPSVTVGPYPGVPYPMMGWEYSPTASDQYNVSTFRSYTITATNSGDPGQYAAAYQAIIDSWDEVIEGMAQIMGPELGPAWLSDQFSGIDNQYFPWWDGVAAITQTGRIDPSSFVDVMNQAAYNALRPALNEAMNMLWRDVRDNSGVWGILTPEMRASTSQAVWDLPHTEGSYLDFGQNFQDYMTGLSAIAIGLDAIKHVTDEITRVIDEGTVDRYTLELQAINDQFDEYASQLSDMGVDLSVYTDLERGRQIAISEWIDDITADMHAIVDAGQQSEFQRALDDMQDWYDQQLEMSEALRSAMTDADYASWLSDLNLAAEYQARELVDRYITPITEAISDKMIGLMSSDLNPALPTERLDQMDYVYQDLLAAASTGDADAINEYLGFVDTYLEQQQDVYKSSVQYQEAWNQVQADMAALGASVVTGAETIDIDSEALAGAVADGISAELDELRQAIADLQILVTVETTIDGQELAKTTSEVIRQTTSRGFDRVGV